MSDVNKLAKFAERLAIFLAAFSLVDFGIDLVRFDLTLATVKSFSLLTVSALLYLAIHRPTLFKGNA